MKIKCLDKIETFFGMPISDIVKKLHIDEKISINELSKRCGVSRQTITTIILSMGLKTRSIKEACELTKNKGDNHWAFGKRKETDQWAKDHSERMKKNNPILDIEAAAKRAISIADNLEKRNLPQEQKFMEILKSLNIPFTRQKAFGPYNADFFIVSNNLAIEIDSTDKWGKERRKKANERDSYMFEIFKVKTIRINKKHLNNHKLITDTLVAHGIVSNIN